MIAAFVVASMLFQYPPVVVDPYASPYRPYQYSSPAYRQYEEQRAINQWNMDRNQEIIEREKEDYRHEEEMRELRKQREAMEDER